MSVVLFWIAVIAIVAYDVSRDVSIELGIRKGLTEKEARSAFKEKYGFKSNWKRWRENRKAKKCAADSGEDNE